MDAVGRRGDAGLALTRLPNTRIFAPRVTLVDYKCKGSFSEQEAAFVSSVMKEIEASFVTTR